MFPGSPEQRDRGVRRSLSSSRVTMVSPFLRSSGATDPGCYQSSVSDTRSTSAERSERYLQRAPKSQIHRS